MYTIQSVSVISVAKIMGAIYGALGLLFLPLMVVAGIAGSLAGGKAAALGVMGGLILAILFPIVYAVVGFVAGAIGALLYNLFANWVGGIELQLQAPAVLQPPV